MEATARELATLEATFADLRLRLPALRGLGAAGARAARFGAALYAVCCAAITVTVSALRTLIASRVSGRTISFIISCADRVCGAAALYVYARICDFRPPELLMDAC
jgi:hypothetical protein